MVVRSFVIKGSLKITVAASQVFAGPGNPVEYCDIAVHIRRKAKTPIIGGVKARIALALRFARGDFAGLGIPCGDSVVTRDDGADTGLSSGVDASVSAVLGSANFNAMSFIGYAFMPKLVAYCCGAFPSQIFPSKNVELRKVSLGKGTLSCVAASLYRSNWLTDFATAK